MEVKTYNFKISVKESLNIELTEQRLIFALSNYLVCDSNFIEVKQTKRPKKEEI